ncbi:MAG: hypothetical protein R2733_22545 [Acidimicrobiales bacterium]
MCRRTMCNNCKKPSWAGCGAHVEQVLGDVAPADRCQCDAGTGGPKWLRKILGG